MRISVEANLDDITKRLNYLQRSQIPFAASKTLNQLAFRIAKRTMPEKAETTFKGGATNWTKKGFRYLKSDKKKLFVDVFVDKVQAKYMKFMIAGGTRFPAKRAIIVATKHSRVNKRGNLPKNYVQNILAEKDKYFSGTPNGTKQLPAGIWERYGRAVPENARPGSKPRAQKIRLVALYTEDAEYTPLFPFGNFADQVVFSRQDGFARMFRENLGRAIATMKR